MFTAAETYPYHNFLSVSGPVQYYIICDILWLNIDHLGDKCGFRLDVYDTYLSNERCIMCFAYMQV